MADTGPFSDAKALIVDTSASARHSLQIALNHLGVKKVVSVPRVVDARKVMSQRQFDIILCDYNFDHGPTGREFFEELRRTRALPLSTIFMMVTGEATHSKVADVAEIAPDDYLLKPINAVTLESRLVKAKTKKDALGALYDAFEKDNFKATLEIGHALLAAKPCPYQMDISRFVAQAHLALEEVDEAVAIYDTVLKQRAVPWARIGFHRAKTESSAPASAQSALKNLVAENGDYLDAYDKLARLRAKAGKFREAMEIYDRAISVTPNDVARLQVAGQLAFCLGDTDRGIELLNRAVRYGTRSALLDHRSMLHLAILHYDKGNESDVARVSDLLTDAQQSQPEDFRLQVLARLGTVCKGMSSHQVGQAVNEIRQVAVLGIDEHLTFELACDILSILDRMFARDVRTDVDYWVAQLSRRFCVSSQSAALMADLMRQSPALADIVRENAGAIQALANEGMKLIVDGDYREASQRLLDYGEDTLNARLLAIACSAGGRFVAEDGEDKVKKATARAYELIERFGEGGLHLPHELAERVRLYGNTLKDVFTAPVTAVAEPEALEGDETEAPAA